MYAAEMIHAMQTQRGDNMPSKWIEIPTARNNLPIIDNYRIVYQYLHFRGSPVKNSTVLPMASVTLRVLIVLNWLGGAAILTLLTATLVAEQWTFTALGIPPASVIRPMITGLRAIAGVGLVAVPLNDVVLTRLLAIVKTVRWSDPFVAANARRLQVIAWALLGLQLLSLIVGVIGKAIATPAVPLHFDAGFSTAGWLAVLLTFILARVFAAGSLMREELEGTV